MKKKLLLLIMTAFMSVMALSASGQGESGDVKTIVFGDVSWDSVQVHNRIAAFIIENGMDGYKADFMPGDTLPIINGVVQGDIDVDMESWHSNFRDVYDKGIASGNLIDLGKNMPDAPQGWWIPRYLVEGPDAVAPDLKSVSDLPKYADLFTDPEDRDKGIVYGGVAGWSQMTISEEIFNEFGLEDTFNLGIAGSGSALAGTMVGAYEKGEAWVGYYWAPTAVLGKLDMVRLKGSEYEPADVNILVNKSMLEKAPDVVEFLKKYSTTVDDNNEFLAQMDQNEWSTAEAAQWFLKNKEDVWTEWVSPEVAEKVKAAL
ncbi:ABC transporter substrate-binding protein [Spirochaeta isovalerica]|uniref:Glycine betaine/proline transport system substrate-binding protein n=1 Tax=Spirochaeta isovalerica TaxID=150 RepID=A0A841R7Y5_9SPIO|nr:ABC transporter substrate-binding protein [Spirochaeta isovalerica]MBB6481394.1 glycine betaine/proline transport system substrate-binding protein [Spirochaeta isovalerica]